MSNNEEEIFEECAPKEEEITNEELNEEGDPTEAIQKVKFY
jgi:hypothetical protein